MASGKVEKAKELWNIWDIRVLVLLSLFIQVVLTFLAPLRKRSANGFLKFTVWVFYLSASGIALYIISQISGSPNDTPHKIDLLAFWAPFLLLHLGGPDSITALALEDNELWHRHALELATQVIVTLYVFSNSVNRRKSQLWIPTVLMFVDGCIKYFERTQALYFASIDTLRESLETDPVPGLNYPRMMEAYHSSATTKIPTFIQGRDDPATEAIFNKSNKKAFTVAGRIAERSDIPYEDAGNPSDDEHKVNPTTDDMVAEAYYFYDKFKTIVADNLLSLKERKHSQNVFMAKEGWEALRIIEIELNFMYDAFYTKAFLLDSKQAYIRVISYLAVIASLLWFSLLDKSNYPEVDVIITYILLGGAIALDLCAGVMFVLSDWFIIITRRHIRHKKWQAYISTRLLKLSRMVSQRDCKRWSRSISGYNLLKRCFKDPPSVYKYLGLRRFKDILTGLLYVTRGDTNVPLLVNFIFQELTEKASLDRANPDKYDLEVNMMICSARGNLVFDEDYCLISAYLQPWTTDINYDESLLTWHLATDICYNTSRNEYGRAHDYRDISKQLSDYMVYLLLKQKALVSTVVGMSEKRFGDTCAEAKKFTGSNKRVDSWGINMCTKVKELIYKMVPLRCLGWPYDACVQENEGEILVKFCTDLLNVKGDINPIVAKGDYSRSVLFEARRLVKHLNMIGEERRWLIISKVWLELMSYAAVRCSPRTHVAQLNKGGELLTFVWLIMAHLGFGECFLQIKGFRRTRLLVGK